MGQNRIKFAHAHQAKSPSTLGQQAFDEKFDKLSAGQEGLFSNLFIQDLLKINGFFSMP
jgi:hypothetical protein